MLDALFRSIGSLFSGDTAAAAAPAKGEVETLRSEVTAALDAEAQRTLDLIDDALTAWQQLELRAERDEKGLALWRAKLLRAEREAAAAPPDSPEADTWNRLVLDARSEVEGRETRLRSLQDLMSQARPDVESALRLIEEIGLSREAALSQVDRLEISHANQAARERLAAARLSGETDRIGLLLRAADDEVNALRARADAAAELADTL